MSLEERFWARVQQAGDDECWPWTGMRSRGGYGLIYLSKNPNRTNRCGVAHRVAWELLRGPIPDGLQIDHLCRVRHCVNPAHLEPVTSRENMLRGVPFRTRRLTTHCPAGHEYTEANIYVGRDGARSCRDCWPRKNREAYLRRVAAKRDGIR
jgi:HNH endonuclease